MSVIMGYFTLAWLEALFGFQAEPEPSHYCEHPVPLLRNSRPTLKIRADVHTEGSAHRHNLAR